MSAASESSVVSDFPASRAALAVPNPPRAPTPALAPGRARLLLAPFTAPGARLRPPPPAVVVRSDASDSFNDFVDLPPLPDLSPDSPPPS